MTGTLLVCSFGVTALALAAAHEYMWWSRRKWRRQRGVVVGFKEERSMDGDTMYHPEIEFKGPKGTRRFVSTYGDSWKPALGKPVNVLIDERGESGEQITFLHRVVFTLVPLVIGLIFMWVGLNLKSPTADSQGGGHPTPGLLDASPGMPRPL